MLVTRATIIDVILVWLLYPVFADILSQGAALNNTVATPKLPNVTTDLPTIISEGGRITQSVRNNSAHLGQEHTNNSTKNKAKPTSLAPTPSNLTVSVTDVPIIEESSSIQPHKHQTVPRKEAIPEKNTNVTTFNATKPIIRLKPLITESSDDIFDSSLNDKRPPVSNLEYMTEKDKHKKADYVVPIVAVILSVPLVAIIISVLYKRSSEWWQHRHYRRMDFLIDGMYNN